MPGRYLRPRAVVGHIVVLAAVLTCLRLGWWQWDVSQRPGGTAQNLGYAILWPVFAVSFVYMWLRLLQLGDAAAQVENRSEDQPEPTLSLGADDGPPRTGDVPASGAGATPEGRHISRSHRATQRGSRRRQSAVRAATPVGVGFIAVGSQADASGSISDDDAALAAYNRALAQLAQEDHDSAH